MPRTTAAQRLTILHHLHDTIATCDTCARLRTYCQGIGEKKRRAYLDWDYWARPVPGFGDPNARVLVLGLAPGAHGGNRTGRIFTGDASGDFLYQTLHDLGFANQPTSAALTDGLRLRSMWIGSVVRCAPPGDKPTPTEIRECSKHLASEIAALPSIKVVVCLGKIAWDGYLAHLLRTGIIARRADFHFTHGAHYLLPNSIHLLGSYHPSQRNTNTGKLNRSMFARVFVRARELAGLD